MRRGYSAWTLTKTAIAASCLILGYQRTPRAAPPPGADPDLAPWFRSLRQPQTNLSCCDPSDCRSEKYRVLDGHFQAFIGNEFAPWQNPPHARVDVPEENVLHRHDNPTGEGVACWAGTRIICFVQGTGT
jgi:hypothetical protein